MPENYWFKFADRRVSRRRVLAMTGGTALGAALVAACSDDDGSNKSDKSGLVTQPVDTNKQAKRGGVFKDRAGRDPSTLDIYTAVAALNASARQAYSTLVREKPGYMKPSVTGDLAPDIAESWEWSPDGLQVTLKLRQGVKWHNKAPVNGRAFDMDDVLFSWNRFATKGTLRSLVDNAVNPSAPVLSFTAPDSKTIIIKLKEPLVYGLELFASYASFSGAIVMIPKETDTTFDIRTDMIGTGPFVMSNYTPSVGWTLKRHPEYFDQDFALVDQVDMPMLSEYAATLGQFKAGNIYSMFSSDTSIRQEDVLSVKREEPRILIYPTDFAANSGELTFGVVPEGKSPFLDERVRHAVSMSWDRDLWIDVSYNVSGFEAEGLPVETRWNSVVPAHWDGWWLDPKDTKDFGPNAKYYEHNVVEAKKLLAAAGYPTGLNVTSHYTASNSVALHLDGMAADIGIEVKIHHADNATEYIPLYRDGRGQYEGWAYHTISGGLPRDISPVSALAATYWSKSGVTFKGFSASGKNDQAGDPQLDGLIEKARVERDTEKRRALMFDLQRYLAKAMYGLISPGGASGFTMAWPAVGNFRVFRGATPNIWTYYRLWLDQEKPPFTRA